MAVTREQVFSALFARLAVVEWGGSVSPVVAPRKFKEMSRRVKLFNEAKNQPAAFQAEHDENVAQVTNMPYKQVWNANWIIYQNTGNDPKAVPAIENNLIIDACFEVLKPRPEAGVSWDPGNPRYTLGGLVYKCYINGEVFKDPGDIDNQGMIVIPITMLIPN